MRTCRVALFGLLAVCAIAVTRAQQPQQQPQQPPQRPQPTFRAGVSAVRVDVIVTDREGTPAANLTATDFEVLEDGKPQTIDSCRLIRVQTQQAPGGEAPRAIRTFEDEETELRRDDVRIVVMLLDDYHVSRLSAMNLRGWLHRFIDTQLGPYDLLALMYPMTPTSALTFTRDKFALTSVIDRFEGRRGDYMPHNDLEANYSMEPPWRIEEIRSQVVGSAIKSACYHLGTLNEGRKSLIVVSETLPLPPNDLRELIEAANGNNVAIYTLNRLTLSAFSASDALRSLAAETNGREITGRGDLDVALGAVLRDSSAYYLLGYTSARTADGRFHEIKVRLKKPGLEVRARKGYWAPTPEEAARAAEPSKPAAPSEVTAALSALAQPRGRIIRSWLGASRGDSGRTRLTFVWEPAPAMPGGGRVERAGRVLLTASGPDGASYFDGPVADRRAVFDVPPGRVQIKLTVEAASDAAPADVIDTAAGDIVVPDLSRASVALSTPVVFATRTPREFRDVSSNPAATPTVRRQFSRTDRLLIRFEAYGTVQPTAQVTARLLNRQGDAMTALPAQPNAQRAGEYTIDLPLSTFARGDYVIEITAKGPAGEARELVAIRVTG